MSAPSVIDISSTEGVPGIGDLVQAPSGLADVPITSLEKSALDKTAAVGAVKS